MPQLDPTWFASQLFWLAICFVALYFVLSRFVLPPLQEVMARRASTVEGDLSLAQSLKGQAEHARSDYERTLADARERAQAVMNEATESYKAKSETATKETDRQIELKLTDASSRIAAKKEEMIEALAPTMGELTSLIFEKLTQQSANDDKVHRILNELHKSRR
jgi:F-type H+-transporting ATPase subunit b